jgi:hypothetical protein
MNELRLIEKRIIFVGIHNKPGLPPLCSTTRSGKVIDACIKELKPRYRSFKSNLFDTDYYPVHGMEHVGLYTKWRERVGYNPVIDIVVLLGAKVQSEWRFSGIKNTIPMRHSSSWATKHTTTNDFVLDLLIKLEEYERKTESANVTRTKHVR